MLATDVAPNRLDAAKQAAKQFAQQLTPGVNLGLISFTGNANVLVSPTPQHGATIGALDSLKPENQTAIGEAIFAALQSLQTVAAVLSSGGTTPPPARIVVLSDGKENKPSNPDNPHGANTAARAAKDQGVPVSTISFGTQAGIVAVNDQQVPVPVGCQHAEADRCALGRAVVYRNQPRRAEPQLRRGPATSRLSDCAGPGRGSLAASGRHHRHHRCARGIDHQPSAAKLTAWPLWRRRRQIRNPQLC